MNGVCSITMNGKQVPLKFGLPACRYFFEHIGQEHIAPLSGDSVNETGVAYLLYAGYYNHCLIEDKVPELQLADFFEHVDLMIDDDEVQRQLLAVGECFQQSKSVQKFIEKTNAATEEIKKEIKKKSAGMNSNPSATENSDLPQVNTVEQP